MWPFYAIRALVSAYPILKGPCVFFSGLVFGAPALLYAVNFTRLGRRVFGGGEDPVKATSPASNTAGPPTLGRHDDHWDLHDPIRWMVLGGLELIDKCGASSDLDKHKTSVEEKQATPIKIDDRKTTGSASAERQTSVEKESRGTADAANFRSNARKVQSVVNSVSRKKEDTASLGSEILIQGREEASREPAIPTANVLDELPPLIDSAKAAVDNIIMRRRGRRAAELLAMQISKKKNQSVFAEGEDEPIPLILEKGE